MTVCVVCENKIRFIKKYKALKECQECHHIFADIELDFNEIKKIYSNNYFFGEEYISYIDDEKQIKKNSNKRLKVINNYIKKFKKLNLYEIGCAYGFFLNTVKNNLKLNVKYENFLEVNIPQNKFNIFCMFDVIEHLLNPQKYIRKIYKIADSNSLLFLTTGDIGSLNAKFKGENWRLIHPPSHIHYFSKKTIKKILENNGFEILSIEYCGYYRNLSFILNKIEFLKNNFKFLLKFLNYFKVLKLDIYLNIFDIMFVIAKKKMTIS